jgi:hypothetical protein
VPHTWRLIEGGGHSWGSGFQDNTLPYSFAMVGAMFAGKPEPADPSARERQRDQKTGDGAATGDGKGGSSGKD